MKKLTKKQWVELKIFNPHEIAKLSSGVTLQYLSATHGRGSFPARWQLDKIGVRLDPKAHWMDYGRKAFYGRGLNGKATALEEAKAWAKEHLNITEWERDPWGTWHPAGDMEKAAKIAAERVKAQG